MMSFLLLRNAALCQARRIVPKYSYKSVISLLPSTFFMQNSLPSLLLDQQFHPTQSLSGARPAVVEKSVEDFVQAFQLFNLFQSSDEEISRMKIDLNLNLPETNYEQLVELVRAFRGENWSEPLNKDDLLPETFVKNTARTMLEEIRSECNIRLKSKKVEEDKFISLSNDNFQKVLELCHDWTAVDKSRIKGSFTSNVINHLGDQERGTSSRRFKHFSKDGFVSFCVLMRMVNLADNFHKYYCMVKFVDLFPQMTEDDIGKICHTFHHHHLVLPPQHPMNIILKTKLVDYLIENIDAMQSENLSHICIFLHLGFPYNLEPKFIMLQAYMFQKQLIDRHDIRTLITVVRVTSWANLYTRTGVNKDFLDTLVDRVIEAPTEVVNRITLKDISLLVEVIRLHRDTPKGRLLVMSMTKMILQRLKEKPIENSKSCIRIALNMAHMGMYDSELLEQLFMCDAVTVLDKDGGRMVSPSLRYDSKWHNRGGMGKGGGDLLQLKGMVELELPGYNKELLSDFDDSLKFAISYTPLEVRFGGAELEDMMTGYHVSRGLEFYDMLCGLWGEGSVWETYVMPFTGQCNYILRVNMEAEGISVGEKMRQKGSLEVKHLEEEKDDGVWIAFYLLHPNMHNTRLVRSGGVSVIQRLLDRLGYKGVVINLQEWDSMDIEQKNAMIKMKVLGCIHARG